MLGIVPGAFEAATAARGCLGWGQALTGDGAAALASERHLAEGLALFRDIGYSEDEEVRNGLLMLYNLITKHVKPCQNCI